MISDLCFIGEWRAYQARILAEVEASLADGRLHIVAAPGSGKTTLGIELVRRMGRPALILAPTITIRNQWADRLARSFLAGAPVPDWVSPSLAAPGLVTICTYQALYAAWAGRDADDGSMAGDAEPDDGGDADEAGGLDPLVRALDAIGPVTIMLDEAHHLRREWWRALQALIGALDRHVIVSLTATPPYDVDGVEWRRYEEICGPVDAEIAIPDLVRHGDLCPHQDHVHVSMPFAGERDLIEQRRAGLTRLFDRLLTDPGFIDQVAGHGWLADPAGYEPDILEAPEFLSAMLIFLHGAGRPVARAPMRLIGARQSEIPLPSPQWMETLLDGMLFTRRDGFDQTPELRALKAELQGLGAVEGGHVRIRESAALFTMTANSSAKLGSIVAIARAEAQALGERLRMVVLTDFVRAGDLPGAVLSAATPARLGVASIFGALHEAAITKRLGVLSGTLVIVPEAAMPALRAAAITCGVALAAIRAVPLAHCPGHARVALGGADNHRIVEIVTRLFADGAITLLVGTQALLGEGWDAPSINSLVLASNAGSYMLSNQMRGRAIRTDPADPAKVANIWHLATILPQATGLLATAERMIHPDAVAEDDPIGEPLGPDVELLKRRFRSFAGIGHGNSDAIESGMARLRFQGRDWDDASVDALNAATLVGAADRAAVAAGWRAAIGDGDAGRTMRQVARPTYAPRMLAVADTLQYLALTGVAGAIGSAAGAMRQVTGVTAATPLLLIFAGLVLLYALPKLARAGWLLARNGTLEGSIEQVGRALLDALDKAGLLGAAIGTYEVAVDRTIKGERLVTLLGADRATERLFLTALAELLGPVRNPRYLLVRESWLGRRLRVDFHAVPAVLGQHKDLAEHFARCWRARVGGARLVFTRTGDGRRALLRARSRSFAAGFRRNVDTLSVWR